MDNKSREPKNYLFETLIKFIMLFVIGMGCTLFIVPLLVSIYTNAYVTNMSIILSIPIGFFAGITTCIVCK